MLCCVRELSVNVLVEGTAEGDTFGSTAGVAKGGYVLAEASKDARNRADNILRNAGGASIARLRDADMGVINVNWANSTETSWEGNNDTSSLEKDIITIVHITYQLQ